MIVVRFDNFAGASCPEQVKDPGHVRCDAAREDMALLQSLFEFCEGGCLLSSLFFVLCLKRWQGRT